MMSSAIFLSASIPDPRRSERYSLSADTVAITSAVNSLLYVTLGRRKLVWGGHPAITPIVWETCKQLNIDYASWVRLYQSEYFVDEFPEDNERFRNVVFVGALGTRDESLFEMRSRMFSENVFSSAVFIGGMEGILEEFRLFRSCQPDASILPVRSTGGATLELDTLRDEPTERLESDLDYVTLFHDMLGISPREKRYRSPEMQPEGIAERMWDTSEIGTPE